MNIDDTTQVSKFAQSDLSRNRSLIGISVLAGIILTLLCVYIFRAQLIRGYFASHSQRLSGQMAEMRVDTPTPDCIPEQVKSGTDKDLIVYTVMYDEVMIPRLQALLAILSDATYKELVSGEIARQTSEVALMKSLYASLYGTGYPKNATSSLETLLHLPDDNLVKNDYPGFTERDRLSLMQGQLQYIEREFYSFAALSKNAQIKKNASDFSTAKARFFETLSKPAR